MRRATKFQ